MTDRTNIAGAWLRIVGAALLMFAGMAHRPVAAAPSASTTLAIYVLPDGSQAELCVPGEGGKSKPGLWYGCEVCRIAAGAMLPDAPTFFTPVARTARLVVYLTPRFLLAKLVFRAAAPPTGPPSIFA